MAENGYKGMLLRKSINKNPNNATGLKKAGYGKNKYHLNEINIISCTADTID